MNGMPNSRDSAMSDDIGHVLKNWPYDPNNDENIVRLILGDDGDLKVQMRIDMGLLQMELDGNPRGENPEGFESWLDYYEENQRKYESGAVDDFFSLTSDDCKKLRQEGVEYYYRYLSLMKLADYKRVIRDTERNLRLFAFVKKYASREIDRWSLDQFRPYVIMINTQAKISMRIREFPDDYSESTVALCDSGIGKIVEFYNEYGIGSEIDSSIELSILKTLKTELLKELPETLEERLQHAITEERFEDAAHIRDEIRSQRKKDNPGK